MSYKTAKALKNTIDVELDAEQDLDERNSSQTSDNAPAISLRPLSVHELLGSAPGRKSLIGRRRRFTTAAERVNSAARTDERVKMLLQFFVTLGMVLAATSLDLPYATEIRLVVALAGTLPTDFSRPVIDYVYNHVSVPVLVRSVPYISAVFSQIVVTTAHFVAPAVRYALAFTVHASVSHASTADLLALEASIADSATMLTSERQRRRQSAARRSSIMPSSLSAAAPRFMAYRAQAEDDAGSVGGDTASMVDTASEGGNDTDTDFVDEFDSYTAANR
jgi:hypothetical protein